jgi:hypothetical protein
MFGNWLATSQQLKNNWLTTWKELAHLEHTSSIAWGHYKLYLITNISSNCTKKTEHTCNAIPNWVMMMIIKSRMKL